MKGISDSELITMMQKDNIVAFDTLYWKYHQSIYNNILKIVKDSDSSKDILQEVFISLWEKRVSLDRNQSVGGWLFVNSYNKSLNFIKKKLNLHNAETILKKELFFQTNLEGEDQKEKKYQLIQTAVKSLSPQRLKVFTLCKLQGKSYSEAAEELNISKYTVKEHLSLAMFFLKEYVVSHSCKWKTVMVFILCSF